MNKTIYLNTDWKMTEIDSIQDCIRASIHNWINSYTELRLVVDN